MVFALIAGIFLVILVVSVAMSVRDHRLDFEARFPPISDEEFLARCGPGTNRDIALRVRRIVANHRGIPYERIYPSSRFVEDLDAD